MISNRGANPVPWSLGGVTSPDRGSKLQVGGLSYSRSNGIIVWVTSTTLDSTCSMSLPECYRVNCSAKWI